DRALEPGAGERLGLRVDRRPEGVSHRVGQRAHRGTLLRRQLAEPAQDRAQRSLAAEVAHADRLQALRALGRGDLRLRGAPEPCQPRLRLRRRRKVGLGQAGQLAERPRVVERQGGEDLAVHRDTRGLQAGDEAAVGQAVLARRRVDARDPQAAEVALALPAFAIGVVEAALDGFASLAVGLPAAADVPLGGLHRLLVPAARLWPTFGAWHGVSFGNLRRPRSAVREQALDVLLVGLVDEGGLTQ